MAMFTVSSSGGVGPDEEAASSAMAVDQESVSRLVGSARGFGTGVRHWRSSPLIRRCDGRVGSAKRQRRVGFSACGAADSIVLFLSDSKSVHAGAAVATWLAVGGAKIGQAGEEANEHSRGRDSRPDDAVHACRAATNGHVSLITALSRRAGTYSARALAAPAPGGA